MHGLERLRVVTSFTLLVGGIIAGVMLPGMQRGIEVYMPVPPTPDQLSQSLPAILPLPLPLLWIIDFLTVDQSTSAEENTRNDHFGLSRIWICLCWGFFLMVFLPISQFICQTYSKFIPQIASRKLFHFLSVAMFTPVVLLDEEMMFLSFSVAFCALLLIEYFR